MKTVLCFGDSNTWGYDPEASFGAPFPRRHPPAVRWTGVLAAELGPDWRVIEEGQNGRTTVHEDPFAPARNGRTYLPACLESQQPVDVVVLMLGTNDLKIVHSLPTGEIATGAGVLARLILQSTAGPRNAAPKLLIVAPPAAGPFSHLPDLAEKFAGAEAKAKRFPELYRALAAQLGATFLNAQAHTTPSRIDGLHLDTASHAALGQAIAAAVRLL
ncbi:MAG: SGNH/GDSL hydrolase family protein [Chthoniobacter sp.]|uniref:SGNH/GDSL hydrolase family protein n=1 Tax=Chthoniobacter sp. TaxID=2510640 RepID=UPI0032A41E3A